MQENSNRPPQFKTPRSDAPQPGPAAPPLKPDRLQALRQFAQRLELRQRAEKLKQTLKTIDWHALAERISHTVQKQKLSNYGLPTTIILSTYFIADLSALFLDSMIPEPHTTAARVYRSGPYAPQDDTQQYESIFSRNLFNSRGLIPGEDIIPVINTVSSTPVKSNLPMTLIGILAMTDERRSIATIEDRTSGSRVYSVQQDDEIVGKLRVTKVEAYRVIFINLASGRLEFLELPETAQHNSPKIVLGKPNPTTIEQKSATHFKISKAEVDKTLEDLNLVLTQARAVPNFENGIPRGYKMFQIAPGSIYEKLGLKNGDIITGLNGQPINDPGKAFEMLSELKTSSHMELQGKKNDGRPLNYTYDIH